MSTCSQLVIFLLAPLFAMLCFYVRKAWLLNQAIKALEKSNVTVLEELGGAYGQCFNDGCCGACTAQYSKDACPLKRALVALGETDAFEEERENIER